MARADHTRAMSAWLVKAANGEVSYPNTASLYATIAVDYVSDMVIVITLVASHWQRKRHGHKTAPCSELGVSLVRDIIFGVIPFECFAVLSPLECRWWVWSVLRLNRVLHAKCASLFTQRSVDKVFGGQWHLSTNAAHLL